MLNVIWISLMVLSLIIGAINGKIPQVVEAIPLAAKNTVELAIGLLGMTALWLGIMKIAEEGGLVRLLARALSPVMKRLFKDVPHNHPAMGAMLMNFSANFLGLGNAATPFGLRAMTELEKLNSTPGTATNAMCTFLAINTSSIQLIPATSIAYLAAGGDPSPTRIIIPTLVATTCSTIAALIAVKSFEKLSYFRIKPTGETQK